METTENKAPERKIPSGRLMIEVFPNASPEVKISGTVETRDIQLLLVAVRKAYALHLQSIGESNKMKQAEVERLKKVEEDKLKKVEGSENG